MTNSTDKPIRLGLMSPLTGLVSMYGQEIAWAGRIACDEINAAGGIQGRRLELIIEDDGSLPETAVPAAERLLDEHGCVALIGNLLSNSRIAVASQVAEVRQVPYLNFSFYEGSIQSRYFFHFAALPNQQIEHMIPYMAREIGPKMFFAGSNYEWPRGSIDAATHALSDLGGEVVGEEYLPLGRAPIDKLLDRVRRSGADVFVPYFAGAEQAQLLTRFSQLGLKRRITVVMGHYDEAMAATLTPEVREGFYSCNTYFMGLDTPVNQRYLKTLATLPEVSGIWPDGNGVLTNFGEGVYLCVHAFARAGNQAATLETQTLIDALTQVEVEGPQGRVRMDPATHHAHVNTYLARATFDGHFEIVTAFGCLPPQIPERYRQSTDPAVRPLGLETAALAPLPPASDWARSTALTPETTDHILASIDVGVLAVEADGVITEANRRVGDMFGYRVEELIGLPLQELIPPPFRQAHAAHVNGFLKSSTLERRMSQRPDLSGYRKDGSTFPAEVSLSKIRVGERWVMVATMLDVTERRLAEEELVWRAIHDPLTGLANRAMIHERLERALRRSKKQGHSVALLFIDLDGFKLVNDSHGHQAGDELLKTIAQRLVDHVRPGDTIGRLGGDEFVVLCDQVDTPATVANLADRLNDLLRKPVDLSGRRLFATASIGLAIGHGTTHSADDLLRNADAAMYQAKEQGRDGWRFFSEEIHDQARRRLDITNGLRQAIERDEFQVRFQPILCAQSQIIRGAELLLRWFPSGGEVSPAHFVPIAEMSGSIVPIGKWVFHQACLAERQWRDQFGAEAPYVSVNVSARQLNDESLVEEFRRMMDETGADPKRILLELTETSLMSDVIFNLSVLHQLADLGLRVAVDDFGTGYSSLAQLLRLPLSKLKIDREFVDGLDKRHDSRAIVHAVCSMARAMNLKVIAEGVENANQFDYLRDLGCDYVQGFHFYRPLPPEEFQALLCESNATGRLASSDDLYSLLYVSQASQPMTEAGLRALLHESREFNRAQGITGFLLYFNESFMQILEGQRSRVQAVLERIRRDPRHQNLHIVFEDGIDKRLFVDWSMGFRDMEHMTRTHFLRGENSRAIDFLEMAADPRVCYNFIAAFAPDTSSLTARWDGGRDDPRR
ncbi:ABC transporter substrate-binding protein [Allochromatium palmeri]|uniref:ABC transporter substrate-binding protein n=1 Tax=Allochromatium palmeri TaxID=231048 RepID=A0A6N8E9N4_9GAMM|nr:ABC transporter substrate-binding protein [Allochromatium palmeri]MTW21003.1 ABC transporter substrate-binding protein [Allochromatium palmeri]